MRIFKNLLYFFTIFLFLLLLQTMTALAADAPDTIRTFSRFSMHLPPGWDGDEQSGFISDNRDEYCVTVARKAEDADKYEAQISIYLLPNVSGHDSETAAKILAQAQADSTEPVQDGDFFIFHGEPRTSIVRGSAKTLVRTNPEKMLVIIAQNPNMAEADSIIASLRGISPEARSLLGR